MKPNPDPARSAPNPVSAVAHALRTPLTVITSTVNNLLDGAFGSLSTPQRDWLKKLGPHLTHLETLLNEILVLLKAQSPATDHVREALSKGDGLPGLSSPVPSFQVISPTDSSESAPLVLVVDDEPDVRDVIQEGLGMQGINVITASTGDEGLKLAMERKPDVILLDVFLKNENGMDICRNMKLALTSFTPIIMVTGQDDLKEKISGQKYEADDLLAKPFQMVELSVRVGSMLRLKALVNQRGRTG